MALVMVFGKFVLTERPSDEILSFHFSDQEADEAAAKEHEKLLVIPEKASSFRYHPEKICEDQCFYCGGKFGLFDTPCHIAQIKSAERQKKILECKLAQIKYDIIVDWPKSKRGLKHFILTFICRRREIDSRQLFM